jgi:hypothetical protein
MTKPIPDKAMTIDQYIEELLRMGKRSQDPDFQSLMLIYGKERIVTIAKRILADLSKEKDDE